MTGIDKALAYCAAVLITTLKRFVILAPGSNNTELRCGPSGRGPVGVEVTLRAQRLYPPLHFIECQNRRVRIKRFQ
jgi:hypothetical protein